MGLRVKIGGRLWLWNFIKHIDDNQFDFHSVGDDIFDKYTG